MVPDVPLVEVIVVSVVDVMVVSVDIVEDVSVTTVALVSMAVSVEMFVVSVFLHANPNRVIDAISKSTAALFICSSPLVIGDSALRARSPCMAGRPRGQQSNSGATKKNAPPEQSVCLRKYSISAWTWSR